MRGSGPGRHGRPGPGFTLIELLCVLALMLVICAMAIPQAMATVHRSRTFAAAQHLSAEMALARATAIRRSAYVALRFEERGGVYQYALIVDGNRNGVRSRDITSGVDKPISTYRAIGHDFPGVRIALTEDAGSGDAVRAGSSDMVSFSPTGTATASSIYLHGADRTQYAIRVLGATARTRIQRFDPGTRKWQDGL